MSQSVGNLRPFSTLSRLIHYLYISIGRLIKNVKQSPSINPTLDLLLMCRFQALLDKLLLRAIWIPYFLVLLSTYNKDTYLIPGKS